MNQEAFLAQEGNRSEKKLFRVISGVKSLKGFKKTSTWVLFSFNVLEDPSQPKMSLLAPIGRKGRVLLKDMKVIPTDVVVSGGESKPDNVELPHLGKMDYQPGELIRRGENPQKMTIKISEETIKFSEGAGEVHDLVREVGVFSEKFWRDEDIKRALKRHHRGHLRWFDPLVGTFAAICRKIACSQRSLDRVS